MSIFYITYIINNGERERERELLYNIYINIPTTLNRILINNI